MMRKGDMVGERRKSLHIGAFGKEREWKKRSSKAFAYFNAAKFVCHGRRKAERPYCTISRSQGNECWNDLDSCRALL
jgi:hypothetical protein